MATKTAKQFFATKTATEGPSMMDLFNELPVEEQEKVLKQLKEKQKEKPGPGSAEKHGGNNGL